MSEIKILDKDTKAIVEKEWQLFDKVNNIGGRASCQNDRNTFFIMRSSQLSAWNSKMRQSYFSDLRTAEAEGRNLLSEKYAYMMERTSPKEFSRIKDYIPPRTKEKDALIDFICGAHVRWQEDLSREYPFLTGNGRSIHRSDDSIYNTSFETYLWGELSTYSLNTLRLYDDYVRNILKNGGNLCETILKNTVLMYGFASLDEAEKSYEERH